MEKFNLSNGHLGLSSVETLYANVQRVYIKSKNGEEKSRMLKIMLEIKSGLTISLGKVLSLQITDDSDCTFFYSLLLTQEDFSVLKCQQGLLVDFDHFPAQLIKLLDACRSPEYNKFILILDEEDSTIHGAPQRTGAEFVFLKVIETNNFKNLCHISLKVQQGSESDVRTHMSIKIASLSERLAEEEKRSRGAEGRLAEAMKALEAKTKEMTELQMRAAEEKNALKLETSRLVAEEREKVSRVQLEWQQKLEAEKSLLGRQFQKQVSDMNEQIGSLTFNNKNLYEAKCQLETSVKEKNYQIETMEKQLMQLTHEVTLLRKQNSQLDQDYHEKDKVVVGLKTKLAVLEQELKDKGKYLEKQQELLKVANEQKAFLEDALGEKEAHLQRKQAAVQTLSADLIKSNEIIAKLQTDLAANKAKMKLRTDIALEQERILEKKSAEIAAQTEAIKGLEEKVNKLKEDLDSTKAQLEEAHKKLEEKEMLIKKNENVINWLNRRLTESSSGPPSASNLISSRSGSDSMFGVSQPKGSISNLAKGWPPWLVSSIAGNNSSQAEFAGATSNTNGVSRHNGSPVEAQGNESKATVDKSNDKDQVKNATEPKSRGLDPKYFQSCADKEYMVNPQISKVGGKPSTCSSRPTSGRQPTSAYFPKKPVPL